jgi:predicted aspartyl protease
MRFQLNTDPKKLIEHGPTIGVLLSFDGTNIPGLPDNLQSARMTALIDTGATGNSIDGALAKALGLPVAGRTLVSSAKGKHWHLQHLAQIYVPDLRHTIYGLFTAVDLIEADQPFQAILGRTFLERFSMVYVGRTGKVVLDDRTINL